MKIRLLFLGILIHGVLLYWSYDDIYGSHKDVNVHCPYYFSSQFGKMNSKRVLLTILRDSNQRGQIDGFGSNFFINIPKVVYIGEPLLTDYYRGADRWQKETFQDNKMGIDEQGQFIFSALERILDKNGQLDAGWKKGVPIPIYLLVSNEDEFSGRPLVYLKYKLEELRLSLNNQYNDTNTVCLIFNESNKSIWLWRSSQGTARHQVNRTSSELLINERKLKRYADIVPLIAGLISYDIPYDSCGIAPLYLFDSARDKAVTLYCNALNLLNLTELTRQNLGLFKYIIKTRLTNRLVNELRMSIESLLEAGNYTGGLYLTKLLIANCTSDYIRSLLITNTLKSFCMVLALIGWVILLSLEYLQLITTATNYINKFLILYTIHLPFLLLSIILAFVIYLQNWPYTYNFYFQTPIIMFWVICTKLKYCTPLNTKLNRESINCLFLFIFLLILAEEYILFNVPIEITITVAALLPRLPKFRKVPFLFLVGWYVVSCLLIANSFIIRQDLQPGMKYINSSGTVWLLISGLCLLWVQPKHQSLITGVITIFLAISLWLQNACHSTTAKCTPLIYFMWPLFLICVIPFTFKANTKNKIIQIILVFCVPVLLTSSLLEPVSLLIILIYTGGWALIECYYQITHWDNIRRMFFLLYLITLVDTLTATNYKSFKCLLCFHSPHITIYQLLLSNLRLFIIFTCVFSIFRLIIASQNYAYTTVLLTSLVLSLAALRLLITMYNCSLVSDRMKNILKQFRQINYWAAILVAASEVTVFYARSNQSKTTTSHQSFHQLPQI